MTTSGTTLKIAHFFIFLLKIDLSCNKAGEINAPADKTTSPFANISALF